jgi:hypothetical protein
MNAGGKDDLSLFIKTLSYLPNFPIVKTLTVIRDADEEALSAEQSVRNLLKAASFAVPDSQCKPCRPRNEERNVITGYALFPFFNAGEARLKICV